MSTKKALVTKIDKKYKDKKTGEYKELTIYYSKVKDRLKEWREANPRGSIKPTYQLVTDRIIFSTFILNDKGDPSSADATGHATGKDDGTEKIFEKLETISVGRALALLGYAADGEIASSEEMEEFQAYQQEQLAEKVMEITESIGNCTTLDELSKYWSALSGEMKKLALDAKDAKKTELEKNKDVV